jgi:hypothetical protein
MPRLTVDQSIAAGATFDAMQNSQYRYLPWHARVRIMAQTTATGINMQVTAGAEQLQPPTPVDATGTAHKLPTVFTVDPLEQVMQAGDLVSVSFINTTAGALAVTAVIDINPA